MTYSRFFSTVTIALALAGLTAPSAGAVSDEDELTRIGGGPGSGAGELSRPVDMAIDPTTGHVFVLEENDRISEFTPWGNFVRAFGWDVAPGAVNEQQEVRVRAADGQFQLTLGASTTPDLAFDAPGSEDEGPASVEAALNALPSIGGVGGEVRVEAVPGTADGEIPYVYVIAFKGSLAGTNMDDLTIANGTTPLVGGVPSTTFEVRTRADGHAPTGGLESCTAESECQAGVDGSGAGQFSNARGVAVDAAGNVYIKDAASLRVQKFDSAGRFLLMFGGEVNKTTGEGICTLAQLEGGDVCGAGVAGSNDGEFGDSNTGGIANNTGGIAVDSNGKLFVADVERIQRFDLEGKWELSVPVSGKTVMRLDIAPGSGDFYAIVGPPNGAEENVRILDAVTGIEKGKLLSVVFKNPKSGEAFPTDRTAGPIAVTPTGEVFVQRNNLSVGEGAELASPLLQFDANGKQVAEFGRTLPGFQVNGLAVNTIGTLYVASGEGLIVVFGAPPLTFEGPPKTPPEILSQFVTSVDRSGAEIGAEINPHFWSDTRFYVQYGIGKCSEGGCEEVRPVPPGARLTTRPFGATVKSPSVFLEGLKPGTTYHYRVVAESVGGGPVRGIGGKPGLDGEESGFTTYPATSFKADCPNQQFRIGFSAPLPDCRAFEMVSPIDKNNGDIKTLLNIIGYSVNLDQSSTDGNRFTYSSYRAFADPKSAPWASQYMATRTAGVGWKSEAITPAQDASSVGRLATILLFESPYKAFSPDLCSGWFVMAAKPVLAPGATEGARELYRRDNCGGQGYEALTGVGRNILFAEPELQGISADGAEAVFRLRDKLTEDATSGVWQAYHVSKDGLRVICILPSGSPSSGNCSLGTSLGFVGGNVSESEFHRHASVSNALSGDGKRAYWTASEKEGGAGKVYLRLNPGEEQSEISGGECTEPEKACTVRVSETKSTKSSRFLGASADGAKALFDVTEGTLMGSLYLFDAEAGDSTLIAGETKGVVGTSEDLSRIYFVSKEALAGGAEAGKPNLYLLEGEAITFVATLSALDVATFGGSGVPDNTAFEPIFHAARVSPDGSHLAFISTESLTGYDNTDQASGEADSEVYLYAAGSTAPVCVSCNPSGARPQGRRVQLYVGEPIRLPIAATIPPAQNMHHFPRSLSVDGQRLFFNSFDALLPRDTNGKGDVYEWELASGEKECEEKGAEVYVASSGGCLSLISSGQSSQDSQFRDASPDGSNVFFTTNASLLSQDPGLVDVYDARERGGLPAPPEPPGPCQGEACQFAPPAPNDPTPASASFRGAGNPSSKASRGRCAKGKARRKGRCVARHKQAKRSRNANHNRRQSR